MKKVLITPRSFGKYNKEELIARLRAHGIEPVFNPYGTILTEQQMQEALRDMDGLIVGVDPVNEAVLRHAVKLKAIAKYGVGVDNIACAYAKEKGIAVSRTVNANANAVADYAMTLMMCVARRVVEIDSGCHHNDWSKKEALDIYGKTIGVLGLGAIGKGVVKRASGFDMKIYGYDIVRDDAFLQEHHVTFSDADTIIRECDFISLHLPLTAETRHILNKDNLAQAKNNLIIVNTARGGLIDEDDLYVLLKENKIYGLGLDVFEQEPLESSLLLTLPNVIVSSHTAASSQGAINAMSTMAVDNLIQSLEQ